MNASGVRAAVCKARGGGFCCQGAHCAAGASAIYQAITCVRVSLRASVRKKGVFVSTSSRTPPERGERGCGVRGGGFGKDLRPLSEAGGAGPGAVGRVTQALSCLGGSGDAPRW